MSRSPDREPISELTTARLSVYLRCLTILESQQQRTVSSHEMAERFHLNSSQIRKDLATFGEFGTRGVGYDVVRLKRHLIETLGVDRTRNLVIVGAGNLGMALADYAGFSSNGFHTVAMIDRDPEKIGKLTKRSVPVVAPDNLPELVRRNHVEIGVIAVPTTAAQDVYDSLIEAGIRAILNFAPIQLRLRDGIKLKSVDLRINLESLSFYLKCAEDDALRAR